MHALVRRAVTACCLSLVLLLVGCGAAGTGAPKKAMPVPTVDPATQAYLMVLQTDYASFATAATQEFYQCYERFGVSTATQKPHLLTPCRPLEAAASGAAQAALTHLATAAPPPRWQKADAELKQALKAVLPYYAARIHAIDANSVPQFADAYATFANQAYLTFCDPVAQFNAGPPTLSPPLQDPYANVCYSGEA